MKETIASTTLDDSVGLRQRTRRDQESVTVRSINVPNVLSAVRLALAPIVLVIMLRDVEGSHLVGFPIQYLATAIVCVAAITDWLDGYLARRWQQMTRLGQILDPLADKVLISIVLLSLANAGVVPTWMVSVIVVRECAITALRTCVYAGGSMMPASLLGKTKMISQVIAIILLIPAAGPLPWLSTSGILALWVALIASIVSGVDYCWRHVRGVATQIVSHEILTATAPLTGVDV